MRGEMKEKNIYTKLIIMLIKCLSNAYQIQKMLIKMVIIKLIKMLKNALGSRRDNFREEKIS